MNLRRTQYEELTNSRNAPSTGLDLNLEVECQRGARSRLTMDVAPQTRESWGENSLP